MQSHTHHVTTIIWLRAFFDKFGNGVPVSGRDALTKGKLMPTIADVTFAALISKIKICIGVTPLTCTVKTRPTVF
jgi:hypothetical protein